MHFTATRMQDEREAKASAPGTLTATAAGARVTFLALYKPLQVYAVIQGLIHSTSLIADYLDHIPHAHSAHPVSEP